MIERAPPFVESTLVTPSLSLTHFASPPSLYIGDNVPSTYPPMRSLIVSEVCDAEDKGD